jgi:diguanylate cyclase (GGDEF)-like protein
VLGNNKKTIGVFISQANDEFQDILGRGIATKAKELDYNVAFFTNFGGYGQPGYDLGELNITELPHYEMLEGIIVIPESMILPNLEARYLHNIKKRSNCPVVSVRRENREFYNVMTDDYNILNDIITHFIEVHGFTRINFLAGPKGSPNSEKRIVCYKRILTEHNIPIEEERIYYGDFWKVAPIEAVDYWLNSTMEKPQAIVCANDYMALTVLRTLAERGISVPEDIAVTGCDDIEDSAENSPSLTTVKIPVFEMGEEAVNKIHRHNLGMEQPKNSYLKTETIYRASCGCKRHWYHEFNERRRNHILTRETLTRSISNNAYMSADLAGLTKLEDINDKLTKYVFQNENFSHFCMCLRNDWDKYQNEENQELSNSKEDRIMELGLKNRIPYKKVKCKRDQLIPTELAEDQPMVYFFAMLHHQSHYFGYIGISFDRIQSYMMTFQAWLMNVSNALENARIHVELNRLIFKLEDMSIRDDLTGLYNRRVLDTIGKKYLKQSYSEQTKLMVFTADMDKMKYINDNYGHAKGDAALRVVSNALQHAADDDEICIRLGGDEFMVIGMEYDEKKLLKFINQFINELNQHNLSEDYNCGVYVSYGWSLTVPDEKTTIELCLSAADTHMYRQKYDKAAKEIKANLICC